MPTKTERILALLPGTFQAAAVRSPLRALVDAFGSELLAAENSLAAVMRAHWVDHADKGAAEILDLASFAALWGLAPRPDEEVEEFREHLKRYVRTFLEGTSTVQGVLRVTAEALGLRIADANEELDSWWRRQGDELVTFEPRGDDAAELLLGVRSLQVFGQPAKPAAVKGTADLSAGADLREAAKLRLAVDGAALVTVDLAAGEPDASKVSLQKIAEKINAALAKPVATPAGPFLALASPTPGPASRLEVPEGDGDAAPAVLGLPARTVRGRDARPARVTGSVDLSGGADLSAERYLRIGVDGKQVAEIDCGDSSAPVRSLDQIRDAINAALPGIASHDGKHLTLTSPTKGFQSTLSFQEPAAQDARARLFGPVSPIHLGADAVPARLAGTRDLSSGVDLAERSRLRVRLDGGPALTLDCAGPDPAATRLEEIVLTLNSVLGSGVASHDGRFLTLASPTAGAGGSVAVEEAPERDASAELLGLLPRAFRGAAATAARFTGSRDLAAGIDPWARWRLAVAVDGREPVEIDLRPKTASVSRLSLEDVRKIIDTALGAGTASHDGRFLTLSSPTVGAESSLAVLPRLEERRRRFVTQAFITGEAATALLGFARREARGEAATAARVEGLADLSRGVDLRQERFLRLALDGAPAVEIDCAGPRPRATTLAEVVEKINGALGIPPDEQGKPAKPKIALTDGRHLLLVSLTAGAGSRIAFEPPRSADALHGLLGVEPGLVRGREATTVRFTGTVDLAAGIDLPAGAAVKLGIDGAPAVEVPLAAGGAVHASLSQIVTAINVAVGGTAVAAHDGVRLFLASRAQGAASQLAFAAPAGADFTKALFGIAPPRVYQGTAAARAQVVGTVDLSAPADLSVARFLRLGVDGATPKDVDCAAKAADETKVALSEIVAAVDEAFPGVAAAAAGRLVLTSPSEGFSSRVALEPFSAGDARRLLFGDVPAETAGKAPAPATITGEVDLLRPADLSKRRVLRLAVDGGAPLDVDAAGAAPKQTFLDEVVAALNAAVPGLAAATEDARLRLTSPTAGAASRLEILPLRVLEVQEYPPEPVEVARQVRHGGVSAVVNRGAAETAVEIEIRAPRGALAPGLVHRALGWEVRILAALAPGERAVLRRDAAGAVRGEIVGADGQIRQLPAAAIQVRSSGALTLPRGRSELLYLEALVSRFDAARFDQARFAGFPAVEVGIFDAGVFGPAAPIAAVFGPLGEAPAVEVVLRWASHRPGAFTVNLPADLPVRFGGRFNEARFGLPQPEEHKGAVTEPEEDPKDLVALLTGASKLVRARRDRAAVRPPLGFTEARVPFRKPRFLTLGSATEPARLHLAEDGVPGFIEIEAREPGEWGNEISVVARPAGPGAWDILVAFAGSRFENARQVVLGAPIPALAEDLLKPGPIGVLQAKAAGVEARVTRDHTESPSH